MSRPVEGRQVGFDRGSGGGGGFEVPRGAIGVRSDYVSGFFLGGSGIDLID